MDTPDITYLPDILSKERADQCFRALRDGISWTETVTTDLGVPVKLNRKMAYIADRQKPYFYNKLKFETPNGDWNSNADHVNGVLKYLKTLVEFTVCAKNVKFNSVLLNYYKDGRDEIKWHSDKEFCLGDNPVIACVNLGASRKFWLQEKKPEGARFFHTLNAGDLLIMNEHCQENFLHAILKEKEITEPRISLTFRVCND